MNKLRLTFMMTLVIIRKILIGLERDE